MSQTSNPKEKGKPKPPPGKPPGKKEVEYAPFPKFILVQDVQKEDKSAVGALAAIVVLTIALFYCLYPNRTEWDPPVNHAVPFNAFLWNVPTTSFYAGTSADEGDLLDQRQFNIDLESAFADGTTDQVVVYGAGGSSALSAYVRDNAQQYSAVIWIPNASVMSVANHYVSLASYLSLGVVHYNAEELVEAVVAWLYVHENFLLVFEGVQAKPKGLRKFIPNQGGQVIYLADDSAKGFSDVKSVTVSLAPDALCQQFARSEYVSNAVVTVLQALESRGRCLDYGLPKLYESLPKEAQELIGYLGAFSAAGAPSDVVFGRSGLGTKEALLPLLQAKLITENSNKHSGQGLWYSLQPEVREFLFTKYPVPSKYTFAVLRDLGGKWLDVERAQNYFANPSLSPTQATLDNMLAARQVDVAHEGDELDLLTGIQLGYFVEQPPLDEPFRFNSRKALFVAGIHSIVNQLKIIDTSSSVFDPSLEGAAEKKATAIAQNQELVEKIKNDNSLSLDTVYDVVGTYAYYVRDFHGQSNFAIKLFRKFSLFVDLALPGTAKQLTAQRAYLDAVLDLGGKTQTNIELAATVLEESEKLHIDKFGTRSAVYGDLLVIKAKLKMQQGLKEDAHALMTDATKLHQSRHGELHERVVRDLHLMASFFAQRNMREEMSQSLQNTAVILAQVEGSSSYRLADVMLQVAHSLSDHKQRLSSISKAVNVYRAVTDSYDPRFGYAQAFAGETYASLGWLRQSRKSYKQAIDADIEASSEYRMSVAEHCAGYADALFRSQHYEESIGFHIKTYNIYLMLLGEDHERTKEWQSKTRRVYDTITKITEDRARANQERKDAQKAKHDSFRKTQL